MDKYIGFIMVLFLLSMICERVADFLKHSLGERNNVIMVLIGRLFRIGDTVTKGEVNSEEEDRRYFRILKLNIFCGFWISVAIHADLFSILKNIEKPWDVLTWENFHWEGFYIVGLDHSEHVLLFLLGCLFTGLFISFGSKFWHDMLDLLLQVKNLRRKLVDERTFTNQDNIKDFDEFVSMPESGLAQAALEQHESEITRIEGVISLGPGFMDARGGKIGCLEVHLADEQSLSRVPDSYSVKLSQGGVVPVPVNKIVTGRSSVQNDITGAGMLIRNQNRSDVWGAAGCMVRKTTPGDTGLYVLSCYHVLSSSNDLTQKASDTLVFFQHEQDTKELGRLVDGLRNNKIDAAIARVTNADFSFTNQMIFSPKRIRKVTSFDVTSETAVRIFGSKSNLERTGIIFNHTWKEPFDYPDNHNFEVEDLIVIARKAGGTLKPLTIPGDSGSLVVDVATNEALGMVLGGNDTFTFAIKMTAIEKYFSIELI